MPDDTIKNQRPRQMRRRLWKCVSDSVLEVLKIAEKTLGIYKLPLLVDAINDGGREKESYVERGRGGGIRNSEFGMRNQGRRGSTAYRRAQGGAYPSKEPDVLGLCIPSRAGKRRFPSMEDAHTEARYMRRSCRARFGLWRARPMQHCEYNQIASGW